MIYSKGKGIKKTKVIPVSKKEKEIVEKHIFGNVKKIDQKSFIVRDKVPMIKKILSKKFDLFKHLEEIKKELSPLMKFSDYGDGKIQTFILKCIDLFSFVKENNKEAIETVKDFSVERIENIWSQDLVEVNKKKEFIFEVMQEKFWEELTFEDIDNLIIKLAPLMKYYQKEKKVLIRVDKLDELRDVERKVMEVKENPNLEEFKKSPLAQKMIKEGITSKELDRKSTRLNSSHTDISRMPSSA